MMGMLRITCTRIRICLPLFLALWSVMGPSVAEGSPQNLLLLDVDNTLYREASFGIEKQIIKNIHSFCKGIGLTVADADKLHDTYGATIEGLRQTVWKDDPHVKQRLKEFYERVYTEVDVSPLLETKASSTSTGYTHADSSRLRLTLQGVLEHQSNLGVASNSPKIHVSKVLQSMGLARVSWKSLLTPDLLDSFETKTRQAFFPSHASILLDDSETIIANLPSHIKGIHVSEKASLLEGLAKAAGWIPMKYKFDQVEYLKAKNIQDFESISTDTWRSLGKELIDLLQQEDHLVIVDVGAGLLSMLDLILDGNKRMPSLREMLRQKGQEVKSIDYYAYESNRDVGYEAASKLQKLGYSLKDTIQFQLAEDTLIEWTFLRNTDDLGTTVHLRFWDYQLDVKRPLPSPHLVVGCCFADLLDPDELARSMLRVVSRNGADSSLDETLLYFPITFTGVTDLIPSLPKTKDKEHMIPSDTYAFQVYSMILEREHGHCLDPRRLEEALERHGATCISHSSSDWVINPDENEVLTEALLYFFGTVAAPALTRNKWNGVGWIERMRTTRPTIVATNIDLLFRIPHLGRWKPIQKENQREGEKTRTKSYDEICFIAPYVVDIVRKESTKLLPNQVRIKSIHSLISSGTELKVFKGQFDDAALDVSIDGMTDERMAYPMAYGYSVVGRVVECGPEVPNSSELIGKTVFTFAAHASEVVAQFDAVQIVPDGIEPVDAIFLPSIETALSIVHDAHVLVGEDIAVFGQGLIGLLVTSVLSNQGVGLDGRLGSLSTFDFVTSRNSMSARLGATQSLNPSAVSLAGPFDVSIEVSGNGKALQSAIDHTRDGGRVIVGSWYGNQAVDLHLGIDFHRSHKTIKTSQVSEIPSELGGCWTKERRFSLAWDLVRLLKPSRLLTRLCSLDDAQQAYESLEQANNIAVAFSY